VIPTDHSIPSGVPDHCETYLDCASTALSDRGCAFPRGPLCTDGLEQSAPGQVPARAFLDSGALDCVFDSRRSYSVAFLPHSIEDFNTALFPISAAAAREQMLPGSSRSMAAFPAHYATPAFPNSLHRWNLKIVPAFLWKGSRIDAPRVLSTASRRNHPRGGRFPFSRDFSHRIHVAAQGARCSKILWVPDSSHL
jgi:hypothetical protein